MNTALKERKREKTDPSIMKVSEHQTMSMFFRYNLIDENGVAKMKWKETEMKEERTQEEK